MEKLNLLSRLTVLKDLAQLVQIRAGSASALKALSFLVAGDNVPPHLEKITYSALNTRAKSIGAAIQQIAKPGQSAILLYHPGREYLCAFFACLYVGVTAIPVDVMSIKRQPELLRMICRKTSPTLMITNANICDFVVRHLGKTKEFQRMWPLCTDLLQTMSALKWREPAENDALPALLQYDTSFLNSISDIVVNHAQHMGKLATPAAFSAFTSIAANAHRISLAGNESSLHGLS